MLKDNAFLRDVFEKFKAKHPVRPEATGERDLDFSKWIRLQCRPSKKGCTIQETNNSIEIIELQAVASGLLGLSMKEELRPKIFPL